MKANSVADKWMKDSTYEKENNETRPSLPELLNNETGGVGRRAVIPILFAGLAGGAGFLYYKVSRVPGAWDLLFSGTSNEKSQAIASIFSGEPLPQKTLEKIEKYRENQAWMEDFEKKLARLRVKDNNFMFAEKKLMSKTFKLEEANKYFHALQVYMKSIYNAYKYKKDIPIPLLVQKINEFPEELMVPYIICCCGLPGGTGFDYMAYHIFTFGFKGMKNRIHEDAAYFINVIDNVIYLRKDWYSNFYDETKTSPEKSSALQVVWNFLNAMELPQDLIRNKDYYEEPIV